MATIRSYAIVRGYRLEVPTDWYVLSAHQIEALQNGIGPERWPLSYCRLLDELTGFRAAADVHDVDYCLGRTREDRLDADRRFFRNCLRVIWTDLGGTVGAIKMVLSLDLRNVWIQVLRVLSARALYRALRLGARQAFVVSTKLDLAVRGQAAVTEYDDLYEGEV